MSPGHLANSNRLREQADRDLGNSGGLLTVMVYPMLVLCTGLAGDLWSSYQVFVISFVALTAGFGAIRLVVGNRLRYSESPPTATSKRLYCLCVVGVAACWSAYAALTVHLYGRSWTGVLALLITMGIVAVSTSNLVSYFPLMMVYVLVMMLPSTVTMAAHGDTSELLTAVMMLFFSGFMCLVGHRHAVRYMSLSQATFDLEDARIGQEELLLRWRSVVENAPDIIATVNKDRRLDFINRTDGGFTPQQIVGQPLDLFLPLPDAPMVLAQLDSVFGTGEPAEFETRILTPEGQIQGWYSCRAGAVAIRGQVESVVVIATNITERRLLDEELRHSRSQLRRLSAHQQAAVEDERRRISREVHDELGQLLTALKIDLAWLESRTDDEALLARTSAMSSVVDTTMHTVRRIASRLRPPILDDLGPGPALDWLIQDICSRAGLEYQANNGLGQRELDEDCALAVFRVCQEALTNVVRHARASKVNIDLAVAAEQLVVSISDNGIGMSEEQLNSSLGLLGMKERVQLLGGAVSISSTPEGTAVTARFPLKHGEST